MLIPWIKSWLIRPTRDNISQFVTIIQIWCIFQFAFIQFLLKWSLQNFTQGMTDVLSWHVRFFLRKFDEDTWDCSKLSLPGLRGTNFKISSCGARWSEEIKVINKVFLYPGNWQRLVKTPCHGNSSVLCGNPPVTGGFPSQRATNVNLWWVIRY